MRRGHSLEQRLRMIEEALGGKAAVTATYTWVDGQGGVLWDLTPGDVVAEKTEVENQ